MAAVQWAKNCRGRKDPLPAHLMRMLGVLGVVSGRCPRALWISGVSNVLADGISKWEKEDISASPGRFPNLF
ncbi:unnamed protein product, partial [Discosporangium mesarthrocarpum]